MLYSKKFNWALTLNQVDDIVFQIPLFIKPQRRTEGLVRRNFSSVCLCVHKPMQMKANNLESARKWRSAFEADAVFMQYLSIVRTTYLINRKY